MVKNNFVAEVAFKETEPPETPRKCTVKYGKEIDPF